MDPLLDYLNTQSLTHSYINIDVEDIPHLHHAVCYYTQSPSVLHKYEGLRNEPSRLPSFDFSQMKRTSPSQVDYKLRVRLYTMQLRLEIIMSEFRLAGGTISRLKDLFAQLGLQDEIGALVQVITLRSELLEVEAVLQMDSDEKGTLFDHLAKVKNTVNSYIDQSTKLVIDSANRTAALSITGMGTDALRDPVDLYAIEKRKTALDIDIANLAKIVKIKDKSLDPLISSQETIHALFELLKQRPLDNEILIELAHQYLNIGKFKYALWCVSESLLIGCNDAWNIWSLRGEICMLQSVALLKDEDGTNAARNWLNIAISSFCYSIELCEGYIRAWCGLYRCLNKLKGFAELDSVQLSLLDISLKLLNEKKNDHAVALDERENIKWILGS